MDELEFLKQRVKDLEDELLVVYGLADEMYATLMHYGFGESGEDDESVRHWDSHARFNLIPGGYE